MSFCFLLPLELAAPWMLLLLLLLLLLVVPPPPLPNRRERPLSAPAARRPPFPFL
jgi:hypothetical protein